MAALWCCYRGEGFAGYQAQQGQRTVQGEVLGAFRALQLPRNPVVAGRTDRGVSARMQVLSGFNQLEPRKISLTSTFSF